MKFFILIFLFISQSALAQWYFGPSLGYSRYVNEKLNNYDQVSSGPRYGASVGYKYVDAALETFYHYTKTKTDELQFNNTKYIFHANMQSYGLMGKYFVGIFHVRLGFAVHHFNSYVKNFNTDTIDETATVMKEFGAEGKKTYYGPLFGAGIDAPLEPVTPYIVFTSYQLNGTPADIFETEIGVKFKF